VVWATLYRAFHALFCRLLFHLPFWAAPFRPYGPQRAQSMPPIPGRGVPQRPQDRPALLRERRRFQARLRNPIRRLRRRLSRLTSSWTAAQNYNL
jgi:hypothetical protein